MKLKIQPKLKQYHGLTPDLQQIIKILQLSSNELQQEIIKKIMDNPLLEIEETTSIFEAFESNDNTSLEVVDNDDNTIDEMMVLANLYANHQHDLPDNDTYQPDVSDVTLDNLHEYLIWQLNLTKLTELEHHIGLYIIDAINDDGFFTSNIKEIQKNIGGKVSLDKINQILHLIQNFDPSGVGAKNIVDFLLFQLANECTDLSEEHHAIASKIISSDLANLAKHDYKKLCKKYKISPDNLQQILRVIINLKTSPNCQQIYQPSGLIPDVILEKYGDSWTLEINHYYYNVKLNKDNITALQKQHNEKAKTFLKEKLKSANWFIHCLVQRDHSLMLVAKAIMDAQNQFLAHGACELKPLTLKQIAKTTGLHESTVSRIVNNKSIQTPRGVFPLKYFFTNQVQVNDKKISSKKICALIKNLISKENPQHPFSDQQIANQLNKAHNLSVARRTISKYRDKQGILPSRFRRKLQMKEVT